MKGIRAGIVLVAIVAVIGGKVFTSMNNKPGWETVIKTSENAVPAGQAYVHSLDLRKNAKVRIKATELDQQEFCIYWLTEKDHNALQKGNATLNLVNAIAENTVYIGKDTPGEGIEINLPKGKSYIYTESTDESEKGKKGKFRHRVDLYQ